MRRSLKTFIIMLALAGFSYASADTTPSNYVKPPVKDTTIKTQDFLFEETWDGNIEATEEKPEQKSETKEEKEKIAEKKKVEKEKIVKNLNNLLIESYKVKFSKILSNLSYNIKNKSKEEKIKIFSTVLITTKSKIEQIDSNKIKLSENRKEVIEGILNHLKSELEKEIKDVVKEK